tara:strand:- start:1591 stop:2493 length:903 start_codon:yes stop_codon:yes gene_type:complete
MASDLAQLDLNLLHTFRSVVDTGSVLAAAKQLGRTQPAISTRLRRLEDDIGVRLFQKRGRRLELTGPGRAIDAEVRMVLVAIERVVDRARAAAVEPVGVLRVGALPTVNAYLLSECVTGFVREYSEVRVDIALGLTHVQLEGLRAGELDAVVSVGPPPTRGLEVVQLGHVIPRLVLRKEDAPKAKGRVSLKRLAKLTLIGYGSVGDLFFDAVWEFVEQHGLDRDVRIRVAHIQSIKNLVKAGAGASILPDYTVVEPGLVSRPIEGLDFEHPLWLATRSSARTIPIVDIFCDHLKASLVAR